MKPGRKRFLEVISAFQESNVFVLGDLMLDEWIWGKVSRISPEAPVPVVQVVKRTYTPGGASNVAANLRSLEAPTEIAGLIGSDEPGRILKRELRKCGVDIRAVISVKRRQTTLKTRIIAHNQQVVRADVEINESLNGSHARKMLELCRLVSRSCKALLFSDYNKGFLAADLIAAMIQEGRQNNKIIVAGAKPVNLPLFSHVTLLVLNQPEAEQALGKEIGRERDLKEAGFALRDRLKAEAVLITRGEHGMALFESKNKMTSIPARTSQVYDVSGAGDTVVAVATLALAAGASMPEAAYLANCGAGVVVKKIGTATVTRKELEESIEGF